MTDCLALFALFSIDPSMIDLTKTYEVPSSYISQLTLTQKAEAKYCAWKYKIKWKIKSDGHY